MQKEKKLSWLIKFEDNITFMFIYTLILKRQLGVLNFHYAKNLKKDSTIRIYCTRSHLIYLQGIVSKA